VKVEKLTLVADAGTIVSPDGALAQTQGAALWGLSLALHEGTPFENGQVKDTNLDTYTPLRMADVPDLDIEFMRLDRGAGGPGRAGDHRRRPRHRQRHLPRLRGAGSATCRSGPRR
jgi:CO/xanthine dehydrogenase Mo-binding subunit